MVSKSMVDSIIRTLPRRELCPEIRPANAASLQPAITVTFHRLKVKTIRMIKISSNKTQAMDCKRAYTIWRSTHSITASRKDGTRTNKTTSKTTAMTGTICLDKSNISSETLIISNNHSNYINKISKMDEQLIFILDQIDLHLRISCPLQESNNKEISRDHIFILIMHNNNNNKNK